MFHTLMDFNPFVVFDLLDIKNIHSIVIVNRNDSEEIRKRAAKLRIAVSPDLVNWKPINVNFDGNLHTINADIFENIRFLRMDLSEPGILHLSSINLYQGHVDSTYQSAYPIRLKYGYVDNKVYFPLQNSGFFSICSTILYDLRFSRLGISSINAKYSFEYFKDQNEFDPWPELFKPVNNSVSIKEENQFPTSLDHHSDYSKLDFDALGRLLKIYFQPSDNILNNIQNIVEKYNIDYSSTIAICIRGTDKYTEVNPTNIEIYLDQALALLNKNPDCKILIQTDQKQIRDIFLTKISPEQIYYLEELPVTESKIGMHFQITGNRLEFSINLLSIIFMLSKCKYLITHTGNVAYWSVLFRGSMLNVIQNN